MNNKYLLRVSSGKYRGKGLLSPDGFDVRPTAGRIKSSLFNIIRNDLYGASFLDLFAGTGQIGIEALSNGARRCVFVDREPSLVKKNIALVGCEDASAVIKGDFRNALQSMHGEKFDFIFADPPYNDGLYTDIAECSGGFLAENGKLILEHATELSLPMPDGYTLISSRAYGSRTFTFLETVK